MQTDRGAYFAGGPETIICRYVRFDGGSMRRARALWDCFASAVEGGSG